MSFRPFRFLRRRWKWLAALFAVSIAALFASRYSTRLAADRELALVCRQLDEREPGWRSDEILAGIPLLPPAENGFTVLDRLQKSGKIGSSYFLRDGLPPVTESLPLDALIELSAYLETQAWNLDLARSIVNFKTGRHPVAWAPLLHDTLIPTLDTVSRVQWLLGDDCRLAAHQGDFRRAFEDIRAVGSLFDTWHRRELLMVVHKRQCYALEMQCQWAMEALALGEAGDSDLEKLQQVFLELSRRNDLSQMLFFERAFQHKAMENLRDNFSGGAFMSLVPCCSSDTYDRMALSEKLQIESIWWKYKPHAGSDRAAMLRHYTEALEIAMANGPGMHGQMMDLDSRFKRKMDEDGIEKRMLGWNLMPTFAAYTATQWNATAAAGMAAIGLACERYRLKHGSWPATLADLKPAYLAEIPVDPFTNGEFKYVRLPDGVAVYRLEEGKPDHQGTYWDMRRILSPLRHSEKEIDMRTGVPQIRLDDPQFVGPPEYVERIEGWAKGGKGIRLWNPDVRKKPQKPVVVHERPAEGP